MSEMCSLSGEPCQIPWAATPNTDLLSAQNIMNKHGVNQVPVVLKPVEDHRGHPVGILDRECISLTYRYTITDLLFCISHVLTIWTFRGNKQFDLTILDSW